MNLFFNQFTPDEPPQGRFAVDSLSALECIAEGISDLLASHGGCSFRQGLYRLHTPDSAARWTRLAIEAFPRLDSRIFCFGFDWLGRQFALDRQRSADGQAQVLLCDIGFGEALEIPASFRVFHELELIDYPGDSLAEPFFQRWLATGGAQPRWEQCIGYRVPPVLGGADDLSNLELVDMEVYWGLIGQINAQIKR